MVASDANAPGFDNELQVSVPNPMATRLVATLVALPPLDPAVLSERGLAAALPGLAARSPLPVELRVTTQRATPSVERAIYFTVAEALTNVGKHAQAASVSLDISRTNGRVVLEVVDDGQGGADPEQGSGLRGLADRVEALNGRLLVWTPRGGGTRVRAEIPCE